MTLMSVTDNILSVICFNFLKEEEEDLFQIIIQSISAEMNSRKRIRSFNWDEDEKQLFRSVLKEYASIIENKYLDCNSNKKKIKAWEEIHKKFNELSGRPRELSQLKIQWKSMKINARKAFSIFNKETNKTGGGARPKTPDDASTEVKDLMNPAELLIDINVYDSDGTIPSTSMDTVKPVTTSKTCMGNEQNCKPMKITSINVDKQDVANIVIETIEDVDEQVDIENMAPVVVSKDDLPIMAIPLKNHIDIIPEKNVPRRKMKAKNIAESYLKSGKDRGDYVNTMINHSKMLKDAEHLRRMEMAEEEHIIKMAIHNEKLKSAILEREILELKKKRDGCVS